MSDANHPDHQPTQRLDPTQHSDDPTRVLRPGTAGEPTSPLDDQDDSPKRNRARQVVIGIISAVLGFALAVIIVALATDGARPNDTITPEQLAALEADLEQRDAQIAALQAQLEEAEAAAGQRDEDVDAQRRALDERQVALDRREAAMLEREQALDERERAIAQREQQGEAPPADGDPVLDDEVVEGIIDRILEQIREMFRG